MVLPWWATLLVQILNLILSNGTIAAMIYSDTGDPSAAFIGGGGSLINHLRQNPLRLQEIRKREL